MRILFVAPWVPSRMRPRSLGMIKILTKTHEVMVLTLGAKGEVMDDLASMTEVHWKHVSLRSLTAIARAGLALVGGRSLQCAYVNDPKFRTTLAQAVRDFQPDVVHFNVVRSAAFMEAVGNLPVVFDLDEVRSDYYTQLATKADSLAMRLVGRIEAPRMRRVEQRISARASSILVSSPWDVRQPRTHLVRSPQSAVSESPVGVPASTRSPNTLLFVGRMSYYPNEVAVTWFITNVLPLILQHHPEVELKIVGENPSSTLMKLANSNVRVVGRVESLQNEYDRATLAIVPVEMGTGVQMKLIQALMAGLPTVASLEAVTRSGAVAGKHLMAASTASDWARAIEQLLSSVTSASELGAEGRAWALAEYSEKSIEAALFSAYEPVQASVGLNS